MKLSNPKKESLKNYLGEFCFLRVRKKEKVASALFQTFFFSWLSKKEDISYFLPIANLTRPMRKIHRTKKKPKNLIFFVLFLLLLLVTQHNFYLFFPHCGYKDFLVSHFSFICLVGACRVNLYFLFLKVHTFAYYYVSFFFFFLSLYVN